MEEGDVVLCTVKKIEGTSVFVDIEGDGEGSIIVSEIAPGRIRNLRDYVLPNKKIVCKILKVEGGHVHLSLRRVTSKEKQDVLKRHDTEKAILMTLKSLLPNWEARIAVVKKEYDLVDFFQAAKEDSKLVEKFFDAAEREKIQPLLKEKAKEIEIKKEFRLKCSQSNGLTMLKSTLEFTHPGLLVTYLAASRFVLRLKAQNYKEGNTSFNMIVGEIEKRAKKNHCDFEILEK